VVEGGAAAELEPALVFWRHRSHDVAAAADDDDDDDTLTGREDDYTVGVTLFTPS